MRATDAYRNPPTGERPSPEPGPTPARRRLALLWLVCFSVACLLYLATCQRGASWQDSGFYQWRLFVHGGGDAVPASMAHPLWMVGARLLATAPLGSVTARASAFSALGMAVAMANLAVVVALLTGRLWIGMAAVAMLAVTHMGWWLATIAEVYTWSVAGLTAEMWLLVLLLGRPRARLAGALGLTNGLGLSVHQSAVLPLPVYVAATAWLVHRRRLRGWSLSLGAAAWCLGALPFLLALHGPSGQAAAAPTPLSSAWASARGALGVLRAPVALGSSLANAGIIALSLVSLLTPLALVGWTNLRRRLGPSVGTVIGAVTGWEVLFLVLYRVPDQATFALPSLVMLALAGGVGLSVLADRSRGWRAAVAVGCVVSVAAAPVIYAVAPGLARAALPGFRRERELPYRDELRYWLVPWKHNEDSAERFASAALHEAGPDGVIIADWTPRWPILVVQRRDRIEPAVSAIGGFGEMGGKSSAAERAGISPGRRVYVVSPQYHDLGAFVGAGGVPPRQPGKVLYRLGRDGT